MVNIVGEQGTFWVANNFIWGWLLLPVTQLGELVKSDCCEKKNAVHNKTMGYFMITFIIVVAWAASIPLWKLFFRFVLQLSNYEDIYFIVIISVGFYILFAFNNIIDSIFYGVGKVEYMLFQTLTINILFYGLLFVLYVTKVYHPSLTGISLMFAGGTGLDSLLTYGIFVYMLKKEKISLLGKEMKEDDDGNEENSGVEYVEMINHNINEGVISEN
jgi:hypothetical protein